MEGELNRALSELTGERITVIGASRTDAGVHGRGNVAVFDTESPIPAERIAYALNGSCRRTSLCCSPRRCRETGIRDTAIP